MIYEKDYLKYQKITWQWVRGHEQNKLEQMNQPEEPALREFFCDT